jgi:hypothetical protein
VANASPRLADWLVSLIGDTDARVESLASILARAASGDPLWDLSEPAMVDALALDADRAGRDLHRVAVEIGA